MSTSGSSNTPQYPIAPVTPPSPQVGSGSSPSTPYPGASQDAPKPMGDPLGVWTQFLSMSGTPATRQQVEQFLNSMLTFFSKVIFAQIQQSQQRTYQRNKNVAEGKDPDE